MTHPDELQDRLDSAIERVGTLTGEIALIVVDDGSGDEPAELEVLRTDADALVRDFPGIVTIWEME